MNLTLRTFFSLSSLFHEFRVHPSEALGKIAKTIRAKGLNRTAISKGFSPLWSFLLKHVLLFFCTHVLLPVSPLMAGYFLIQCWYHLLISSHCYSGQVLACQAAVLSACVCHCYASVCFLCSMLSDLCSSFWLAWHCHETKSWSVVSAYFLAVFWSSKIFETLTEHHILETWKQCIINVSQGLGVQRHFLLQWGEDKWSLPALKSWILLL